MKRWFTVLLIILLVPVNIFATTINIGIVGQSNGGQMTCPYGMLTDGCDSSVANANVLMWNNMTSAWVSPGTGTSSSAGLVALGNAINNATGWTVHMVNISFGGSGIFEETQAGAGYWWNRNNKQSSYYAAQKAIVNAATGGSLDVIVLMNGECEGFRVYPSTLLGLNPNTYDQSWWIAKNTAFWNQLRSDFGSNAIIIQSQLATTSNLYGYDLSYGFNASWSNVREYNKAAVASYGAHTYIGTCTANFALGSAGIHWTPAGYAEVGKQIAQTILYDKGYVSWYKGPTITGLNAADATHTDILIQHSGGTDFTPTSNITGFTETCNGSSLTISSATRQTSSRIRLTHNACSGTRVATYMYGIYPNVAGVVDNSSLTYPLEPNVNITQYTAQSHSTVNTIGATVKTSGLSYK